MIAETPRKAVTRSSPIGKDLCRFSMEIRDGERMERCTTPACNRECDSVLYRNSRGLEGISLQKGFDEDSVSVVRMKSNVPRSGGIYVSETRTAEVTGTE